MYIINIYKDLEVSKPLLKKRIMEFLPGDIIKFNENYDIIKSISLDNINDGSFKIALCLNSGNFHNESELTLIYRADSINRMVKNRCDLFFKNNCKSFCRVKNCNDCPIINNVDDNPDLLLYKDECKISVLNSKNYYYYEVLIIGLMLDDYITTSLRLKFFNLNDMPLINISNNIEEMMNCVEEYTNNIIEPIKYKVIYSDNIRSEKKRDRLKLKRFGDYMSSYYNTSLKRICSICLYKDCNECKLKNI